ncbi:MAG: FMN-binding glutamate synthase family protein [Flavobacteriales bacterium]|nr:FMN-binding glutamate synthase family protein [Flavobacteriales bacterium]
MNARVLFIYFSLVVLAAVTGIYFVWKPILWSLILFGPILLIGWFDIFQTKHAIKRNFPVLGHFRYMLEKIRPEIMQYFVETDTEGRPINRQFRSLVYQRAKKVNDTVPFGTQMDVYEVGYEWMDHSMYARGHKEINDKPRVMVGGPDCKQPYLASLLNISAMSFGSLSKNAVMALNKGAKKGRFAHNTGEGAISPYHLKYGGDLIWQIGTGYFGCRTEDGDFSPEKFEKNAKLEQVKMIEIKISQGAKPGHGGILPAAKNTEEIAKIRGVQPHTDVHSPPSHSAFSSAEGLLDFVQLLRERSGGKPIGFKLCVGKKEEFIDICKAMITTGIKPDFITVDGGEGGTGAAPIEFSNSLGMPLKNGLSFVYDTLVGYDLKKDIILIGSGKVFSAFDIARTLALGADMVNSARAMMMAAGCIQALQCNSNKCPVGVATQDKKLMKGLDVEDKARRVTNYHNGTLHSFSELVGATGINSLSELNRKHINRRVSMNQVLKYDEIFPYVEKGSLLNQG